MVSGYPASSAARTFGDRIILDEAEAIAADARSRGVRTTQLLFHNPPAGGGDLYRLCDTQGVGLLVFGSTAPRWAGSGSATPPGGCAGRRPALCGRTTKVEPSSNVICFVSDSASRIQPRHSRPEPDFFAPPNGAI